MTKLQAEKLAKKIGFRPLNNRVLVKRDDDLEQTKGGLYIPDVAQENAPEGTVIAVGPGRRTELGVRIRTEVQVGDKCQFGKYAGNDITLYGEPFVILMEDEILLTK